MIPTLRSSCLKNRSYVLIASVLVACSFSVPARAEDVRFADDMRQYRICASRVGTAAAYTYNNEIEPARRKLEATLQRHKAMVRSILKSLTEEEKIVLQASFIHEVPLPRTFVQKLENIAVRAREVTCIAPFGLKSAFDSKKDGCFDQDGNAAHEISSFRVDVKGLPGSILITSDFDENLSAVDGYDRPFTPSTAAFSLLTVLEFFRENEDESFRFDPHHAQPTLQSAIEASTDGRSANLLGTIGDFAVEDIVVTYPTLAAYKKEKIEKACGKAPARENYDSGSSSDYDSRF